MGIKLKEQVFNALVALDKWVNVLLGGDPDETISSRAGKAQLSGKLWGCSLCRFLDFFQKDHCSINIQKDEGDPVP